jgi:hypothetical protein
MTLWGKQAEHFKEENNNAVFAFKGVKVGDFGGQFGGKFRRVWEVYTDDAWVSSCRTIFVDVQLEYNEPRS